MADFEIKITGIDEVCRALDEEVSTVKRKLLGEALQAGVQPIKEAVYARTPVSAHPPSESSTEITVLQHLKDSIISAVEVTDKGGVASVGFGDMGQVANWVEYGHKLIGHAEDTGKLRKGKPVYSHKELGTVEPHPFIRPATETAANAAVEEFAVVLEEYYGA